MNWYQSILAHDPSSSSTASKHASGASNTVVRAPKKIGLLDHMGGGNIGDDATQTAVIQNIRRRWPDSEIYGFSMNPSDTRARHGIRSYPIRQQTWECGSRIGSHESTLKARMKAAAGRYRILFGSFRVLGALIRVPRAFFNESVFCVKSFRTLRSLDLLIISGGGQLLDSWGGPWAFPYTIFKWVFLAKLALVRCYLLNVGAGPLYHPLSKRLFKYVVLLADYVSFRDEYSKNLIEQIGFTEASQVVADCVYSLDVRGSDSNRVRAQTNRVVGISPMAYCDPRFYHEKNQDVYADFLQRLARCGSWLSRNQYDLMLFSTDLFVDSDTIADFVVALKNTGHNAQPDCVRPESIRTVEHLLAEMSSMDYVITCRYHGVILAHLMNIPVLAIAHHPKVTTLMNDIGLSEYCVDIRDFDSDGLISTFTRMVKNRQNIKQKMAGKVALYRQELASQFDMLFTQELR